MSGIDRSPVPVAVLASGTGSNLAALLAATARPGYPAAIRLVLSDRADAGALAVAAEAGIAAEAIPARRFGRDRAAHERALDQRLRETGIAIVCLAGYMRVLTPLLVERWAGRMLNIHPSLLPSFPGLDTHRRALAAGVAVHGCTVHLVTAELDAGPILGQAAVPVRFGDDAVSLGARVLAAEHVLYPATLAALLRDGAAPLLIGAGDPARDPPWPLINGGVGLAHAHDALRPFC